MLSHHGTYYPIELTKRGRDVIFWLGRKNTRIVFRISVYHFMTRFMQ